MIAHGRGAVGGHSCPPMPALLFSVTKRHPRPPLRCVWAAERLPANETREEGTRVAPGARLQRGCGGRRSHSLCAAPRSTDLGHVFREAASSDGRATRERERESASLNPRTTSYSTAAPPAPRGLLSRGDLGHGSLLSESLLSGVSLTPGNIYTLCCLGAGP